MNKKVILRIILGVVIIIIAFLLVWFLYLYPNMIFKENEKIFDEAGKRYYQINKSRLPSEEGRVISVPLSTLIKQKYLEGPYIPYTNKACDINESNVKVVNKNGEYVYYTYLKCGKYESNVDHEGPVITLNGDSKIVIALGDEYKEQGVKSVVDDTDGRLDVSSITIKGNVDTSKVGTYEVTYSAVDSLNNKTEVIRKVVVEEKLLSIVKDDVIDNYYVGVVDNNYVMFNNMLFRIVKLNSDDTMTIVSDEMLASVDYTNDGRFVGSSLDSWLNDYFYNLLENKYKKLVVSSKWCDDVVSKDNYMSVDCSRYSEKRKVGILSIQDYNKTFKDGSSFLDYGGIVWYANLDNDNNPWTMTSLYDYPLKSEPMNQEYLFNVRPALTLKSSVKVLSGDGSSYNPYILVANESAKRNTMVNERQVGEYIRYSGYLWRISNITDDNTTEIIMSNVLENNNEIIEIGYENSGDKVYNPNKKGNLGYRVVNEMTSYVSTKLFDKTKISVPIYNSNVTYLGKKSVKTYNNIITIPSAFDIFSSKGNNSGSSGYWLIDSSKKENVKTVMNPVGSISYMNVTDDKTAAIKVKAYLKDDVFITDGDGTLYNPYTISD